jgi:hypothetical protein
MLRRIRNVVAALILDAQDKATAVIVFTTIGRTRNFLAVCFHQKLREPTIDHSSISWMSGTRKWGRSESISSRIGN